MELKNGTNHTSSQNKKIILCDTNIQLEKTNILVKQTILQENWNLYTQKTMQIHRTKSLHS